uniref:Centromere protein J n=1 Tax=Anolis carolinensis TaxID=28377 RepID=A0A803SNV0_ANOCA|nr:PREDICTED: uncharacterized protein LOC100565553 isoform X1 [Anolis carolinensis]XP_008122962.1 PREDICTED: uncharacterized protein LOC100565553 isoform X1 [Anolis carolinensis]XP_016854871.1 PREDICTED: uncharacterized protein LOC100565553 isoform X1 [Anolis carolinensis]|eukprot:XP_008122957.1 PREDICTED: uncharacterized protein LOC100565553 isoform X1 [Anolis carolinensis]
MEADCSQNGTHRATKDSFGEVPSHHPVEENMGSLCSLSLNWVNSTNGSFTEQLTSSQTSVNSNTAIDFEDMPFNYLANNTSSPDVLPPSQAETRKNNEPWGIPSCCSSAAASPPLIIQEAIISQNCKQNLGNQEQLMMYQVEHLQELVAEQQKIITFYNSGLSASLFPGQLPLENYFQIQNKGDSQIKPTLEQYTKRNPANGNPLKLLKAHFQPQETESWLEMPPITEEKAEQGIDETASLSSFGLRMNTRTFSDRVIHPVTGVSQNTLKESGREQLKASPQGTEQQEQIPCENKVTAQKSFLKHGEGVAKLEQNRKDLDREPAKPLRRVSFDCQNNISWPSQIEKLSGKCSPLKRQISSPTVLFLGDKNTNCIISKDDLKTNLNNYEHRSDERKDSSDIRSHDSEGRKDGKESCIPSQINWSECSYLCNEQICEIKPQVIEKAEVTCLVCEPYHNILENRPIDHKVPLWLMKNTESNILQQVDEGPVDASPNILDLHDGENNQIIQGDQISGLQVIEGLGRTRQCKNEHCVAVEKSPEIQEGFKKVNDQIVKVTPKLERKQITIAADSQRKHRNSTGTADTWEGKHLSGESVYTSTESEDEHQSHYSEYLIKHSPLKTSKTSKSVDLSDADYATDEPSGTEDYSWKGLLAKRAGGQQPTGQQKVSTIVSSGSSSSESSVSNKTFFHLRKSSSYSLKAARDGKDLEKRSSYGPEFNLQPSPLSSDLAASLFPWFRRKANLDDKRTKLEEAQKRSLSKLEECEKAVPVHHRETSLLAQMKEEQAKAMDFLRKQISQLDALGSQKSHPSQVFKRDQALKLQKEEAETEAGKHTILREEEGEVGEIQMLKQQVEELQEEFRRNETQWHTAHEELRSQVEALTKQNLELQDELKISEHQKMEVERKYRTMDFPHRKADTLVSAAILREASSQENLDEVPLQSSHKHLSNEHGGRKTALDGFASGDKRTQSKRSPLQRSESLKSVTGDQRLKSPPKVLRSRSAMPTGWRTPHQMPSEVHRAFFQQAHNQQPSYGKNSLLSTSNLNAVQDESQSLYVKGTHSTTSGSSEDTIFFNRESNDLSSSANLSNLEITIKDNLHCKRPQMSKKPSEQVTSMMDSKRNSTVLNGRKTPAENSPAFVNTGGKASPLKSILSRKSSLHHESQEDVEVKEKIEYPDGKVKQVFMDGRRITIYPNGTKMEIGSDKRTTVVTFYNGDIKKILPDQRVVYYYANAQTTRTIFPSGLEVLQFPNKQIEKYHPDGTEEIVFPDQTVKRRYDGGLEETVFPDGTVVKVEKNGIKTIQFCNGQKEIHTAVSTRREYPDGTVKTFYANDQQESKRPSGHVQIKDKKGTVLLDKK